MSGGYVNLPDDPLELLRRKLQEVDLRLAELERPTGTQFAEAVAKAVDFGSIGLSTTGFTVPTSWGDVASGTMDIPLGYTRAAVLGIVSVGVWNGSGSGDYVGIRCSIDGTSGAELREFAAASSYRALTASAIRTMDGLTPGGLITVAVRCEASSGWGAHITNIANIDVIALFRR